MTPEVGRAVRRTADDRRKQLIGIGLRMLTARPIHQVTVDEVAAEAGISRSLLFHYFPTKQDYYVAVVQAAGRRLLRAARPSTDQPDPARAVVEGYVAFLTRRRTQYLGLFRGPGQDVWIRAVHDDTQRDLTLRIIEALGVDAGHEPTELVVRAWWAFAEELTIEWTGRGRADRDALVDLLMGALKRVVAAVAELD